MFTVKHITLSDVEQIYHAAGMVTFEPKGLCAGSHEPPSPAKVLFRDKASALVSLQGGTVFVMNEAGKTVARYDIGASNVPITGDGFSDRPVPMGYQQLSAVA